jgi:hypothetical protein
MKWPSANHTRAQDQTAFLHWSVAGLTCGLMFMDVAYTGTQWYMPHSELKETFCIACFLFASASLRSLFVDLGIAFHMPLLLLLMSGLMIY